MDRLFLQGPALSILYIFISGSKPSYQYFRDIYQPGCDASPVSSAMDVKTTALSLLCGSVRYFPILESRKFLLVESDFLRLGIRIQIQESGIPLTIEIRNPSSTDKDPGSSMQSRIQLRLSWITLPRRPAPVLMTYPRVNRSPFDCVSNRNPNSQFNVSVSSI